MHILEKWLLFVFCQKRRPKDQQIEINLASNQLMEKQQQQQQQQQQEYPCSRILGERETWPSRPASHSPAQLQPISICADIHFQPDVVPETRLVSYSTTTPSSGRKRNSGIAIEDDIEVLAPMATTEICSGSSSSSSPAKKHPEKKQVLNLQQPVDNTFTSQADLQLNNDLVGLNFHINGSLLSLPISMSLNLVPMPLFTTHSSNRSSLAAEEELYDMDEFGGLMEPLPAISS